MRSWGQRPEGKEARDQDCCSPLPNTIQCQTWPHPVPELRHAGSAHESAHGDHGRGCGGGGGDGGCTDCQVHHGTCWVDPPMCRVSQSVGLAMCHETHSAGPAMCHGTYFAGQATCHVTHSVGFVMIAAEGEVVEMGAECGDGDGDGACVRPLTVAEHGAEGRGLGGSGGDGYVLWEVAEFHKHLACDGSSLSTYIYKADITAVKHKHD